MSIFPKFRLKKDNGLNVNNSVANIVEYRTGGILKGQIPGYPAGYTPQVYFYVNKDKTYTTPYTNREIPIEYGDILAYDAKPPRNGKDIIDNKKEVLEEFNDTRTRDFIHGLDGNDQYSRIVPDSNLTSNNIYLGSFISSDRENEDPTILGFDFIIDRVNSPLFNGAINDFIGRFNSTEIASRSSIYNDFLNHFNKFFYFNSSGDNLPAGGKKKAYYLKKITGLNRLMEQNTSSETKKSFVVYNTDKIKLTLMEDVSQSMGYLSSLYKALSWSRLNGKQIIPPNLLRFNVNVVVTEIRNYTRLVNYQTESSTTIRAYADLISKYTYTLYDCQFFFPNMPHSDLLNMEVNAGTTLTDYDIEFDYKFSTMRFDKFNFDLANRTGDSIRVNNDFIDNKLTNPKKIGSIDTNRFRSNGFSLELLTNLIKKESFYEYGPEAKFDPFRIPSTTDSLKDLKDRANKLNQLRPTNLLKDEIEKASRSGRFNLPRTIRLLVEDLSIAAAAEINRRIVIQARLLNKTLENIRNSNPLTSRMSPPRNIYLEEQLSLRTDLIGAARNFVGRSLRDLFNPPRQ